jgi:cellulose synthase/poly-beta-1,6-N-acetylglucosamine synthase-like glycosyltransferase
MAQLWLAGPILYLSIVSISAILTTKRRRRARTTPLASRDAAASSRFNFAIVIPAHNEEIMLDTLLDSLAALAYPKDRYTVYVVADNCTDRTAELARARGWVRVYERRDKAKRGKGHALGWLLRKLEENGASHDAYVIVDADSIVEPSFLRAMARELAAGAQALQGRYTVRNLSESPGTALRWMALVLICHVRSLGRNGLGCSSTLDGNGMCFSRSLLMRYPWQAYSLVEDYEYYLTLVQSGERVGYVPDAVVYAHMPTTFAEMRTQDVRWESFHFAQAVWQIALRLVSTGVRRRDVARIEAAVELLTPPLSILACGTVLTLAVSALVRSLLAVLLGLLLIGGLIFYVGTGLYLLRAPRGVYKAFLFAPRFIVWKVWVYLVLSRNKKHTSEWVRTSRPISQ